jgi:hypothetical protein
MALRRIIWNSLYAKQPHKRRSLAMRIRLHYVRMGLARRGVEKASVRYIFAFPLRPSGQRGGTESLALRRPVAMSSLIFVCRTIDMVYPTNDAYCGGVIFFGLHINTSTDLHYEGFRRSAMT